MQDMSQYKALIQRITKNSTNIPDYLRGDLLTDIAKLFVVEYNQLEDLRVQSSLLNLSSIEYSELVAARADGRATASILTKIASGAAK